MLPGGLAVKRDNPAGARPPQPATIRGECCGLSIASHRRLTRLLIGVDWASGPAHFVTLTYHREWGTPADWKRHLQAWIKRAKRRWGSLMRGLLWRLEQQERGAPHYHVIIWWSARAPDELELRRWCLDSWHAIAEPTSEEHGRVSTRVDSVRLEPGNAGGRKLGNYLAKYCAKGGKWIDRQTGELVHTGRVWGVVGDVPVKVLGVLHFSSDAQYSQWVRRIRRHGRASRYVGSLTPRRNGWILYGSGADLLQLCRGLRVELWEYVGG